LDSLDNIFIGCFLILIMVKKGDKIKISSNWKLLIIILILIIFLIILIYFILKDDNKTPKNEAFPDIYTCQSDSDCVPVSCCHPDSCVNIEKMPNCKRVLCSMDCEGPLDCGAGHCRCLNGKCSIVNNK
jgi:hypothetical protein